MIYFFCYLSIQPSQHICLSSQICSAVIRKQQYIMKRDDLMTPEIIPGSEMWINSIPDEYAIKYTGEISDNRHRILGFRFVKPVCRLYGSGFISMHGMIKIPLNIKEIIIASNDISTMPDVYAGKGKTFSFVGCLTASTWKDLEHLDILLYQRRFKNIYYYSDREFERQRSDANAPKWLMEFAKKHYSSVAYFEF